ncbi:MAG: elongation factor 1-beta [Candidatus Hydrothermarchaeaceae archaeon]
MAEVLITLKIMPDDASVNIEAIMKSIKRIDVARLNKIEEEPVAFGIVALKTSFVARDEGGAAEKIENSLKNIDGIGSVEVVETTRLL